MTEPDNLASLDERSCDSPKVHSEHALVVHQPGDTADVRYRCPGRDTEAEYE